MARRIPVTVATTPGTGGRDARGVHRLVAEQRHADERTARGDRAQGRPRAAVADHRGRMREDVWLRHPGLDVDVRRHVAELDLVPAGREQHADRQVGDGVEKARVHLRRRRERRGDAAEARVDERPLVARPPVRKRVALPRRRPGGGAASRRTAAGRPIAGSRSGTATRRSAPRRPLAARRAPAPRSRVRRPRRTRRRSRPSRARTPWRSAAIAEANSLASRTTRSGRHSSIVSSMRRQHRVDVQPGEDLAHDDDVPLRGRERRHGRPERAEDLVRRRRAGPERVPARLQRRRPDDERLVAVRAGAPRCRGISGPK